MLNGMPSGVEHSLMAKLHHQQSVSESAFGDCNRPLRDLRHSQQVAAPSKQDECGAHTLTIGQRMTLSPIALLAILLGLQAKHFLFDFVFQSDWQVRNKGTYGHAGGLVHSGLHALGTLAVALLASFFGFASLTAAILLSVIDFVVHYHVDWSKAQISRRMHLTPDRHAFWIAMGADQAAHQATYLGLVFLVVLWG